MVIESFIDLSHIRRLSGDAPAPPVQSDLPFPAPDAADLIEGPRISLRYGSAATVIWVSKRQWRRIDRGDPTHYLGRWRAIDDWSEADNCIGKLAHMKGSDIIGIVSEDEDGFLDIEDLGGPSCGGFQLAPEDIRVIPHPDYLSRFEIAIRDHVSAQAGAG